MEYEQGVILMEILATVKYLKDKIDKAEKEEQGGKQNISPEYNQMRR